MNGVTFGEKHSYRDWGLYLKTRPVISPPSPKTVYIDIPGSDSQIDLTESLTGDVKYKNRSIRCEFWVIAGREKWFDIYSEIMDYLHGKRMKIYFDEDIAYYYEGRLTVNEWASDRSASTIVIEGTAEPYKLERFSSLEDWQWDPFSFETGIIREYGNLRVDGSLTFAIEGRRMSVIPSFLVASDDGKGLLVEFNGTTYPLPEGESRVLNIVLKEGMNTLKFTGDGNVSINYRGGRL